MRKSMTCKTCICLWVPHQISSFHFTGMQFSTWWNRNISPSFHFLPPVILPPRSPCYYALEVVRCWRECCAGSLYNCEGERRESSASVQWHSQWEDSARLSTAAAAAAAAMAAIYCNHLSQSKEPATVEPFIKKKKNRQAWAPLFVNITTVAVMENFISVREQEEKLSGRRWRHGNRSQNGRICFC